MKITIAVPVYNTKNYLSHCLDALLAQTYEDLEILLIDDGATDGSGAICDAYATHDSRVRVIHKENGGVSSARNRAIDEAKGEYLLFVDSDDCIHRETAEIYVRALEVRSGAEPEAEAAESGEAPGQKMSGQAGVVLACDYTKQEQDLKESCLDSWQNRVQFYERKDFLQFMIDEYVNAPWNKLYEVRILREYGIRFDEEKNLGEDFLFNLDYFHLAPAVYQVIHCPLYYYREGREGSLANAFAPRLYGLQAEMFERLRDFMESCGIWNGENQRDYFKLYWNRLYLVMRIFCACVKEGNHPEEARRALAEAFSGNEWREAWNGYRRLSRVSVKDWMKYLHVRWMIWRKYL